MIKVNLRKNLQKKEISGFLGRLMPLLSGRNISNKNAIDVNPLCLYSGVYVMIGVGAIMMVVGFLGCYGAIQESQCLLGTVSHGHTSPCILAL